MGKNAFSNSSKLAEVFMSKSVTKICENAFINCFELYEVSFEENSKLYEIEKIAFQKTGIKVMTIHESAKNCQKYFWAL